jgi:hypothetical protein
MTDEAILLSPVKKFSQSAEMGALVPSTGDKHSLSIEEADGIQPQEMKLLESEKLRLHQDMVQLENKLREATAENEALRNGMHEILDSIHNQDGTVRSSNLETEPMGVRRMVTLENDPIRCIVASCYTVSTS